MNKCSNILSYTSHLALPTAYSINLNNNNNKFVFLNVDILKNKNSSFLIDTGADISIIKKAFIKEDVICFPNLKCTITGITTDQIQTLALCEGNIFLNDNKSITQNFHIVSNEFPIKSMGILGKNFLEHYGCRIDYSNKVLEIPLTSDSSQKFPLCSNFLVNDSIPPRVEKIMNICHFLPNNLEYFCQSMEISPGVFTGNCIIKTNESQFPLSILNTNEFAVDIKEINIIPTNLENYELFQLKKWDNPVESRLQILESLIDTGHLNEEEKSAIIKICRSYNDIFYLNGDELTKTDSITHEITLVPNARPVNIKPYRLPFSTKEEINRQVESMLKNNIIEHSNSPWNSPLLVVPKKSGEGLKRWRVVVDFRKLNDITIPDTFPLPNIVDILDQLGKANYFSTLDLADGYHQVPISNKDKQKTAFSTNLGHYHFNRMPFGLRGAPATFQRMMNSVLSGLNGIKCFVYLDDIVIYGYDLADHNQRLCEIFTCLRNHNLKLQPTKCKFLRKEISYLGHIISDMGILPDPSKITSIKNYPRPKTTKDVKSFLGLASYYRRFINQFSKIAEPLTALLKKSVTFEWSPFTEEAFQKLKEALINPPILCYPDFTKPFIVTTDASDVAIGAILSQNSSTEVDLPIAYASRVLQKAEKNYATIEKELLAIVWALKRFRPYIFGQQFIIRTDHKPLIWLKSISNPSSRLVRWRVDMDGYDYKIEFKSGKINKNADSLSRIELPNTMDDDNFINVVTRSKSNLEETNAPINTNIKNSNLPTDPSPSIESLPHPDNETRSSTEHKGVIQLENEREIEEVLHNFHYNPLGGHQGVYRTLKRIKNYYRFPKMMTTIRNFISKCAQCQKNKVGKLNKCPLKITTTAKVPFEKLFLDVVGPLPITENENKFILTLQDDLTKFSLGVCLPNQETSTIARAFVDHCICLFGSPQSVVTDMGSNFMSELFKSICKILSIKKINTTAYHPQSNGALERYHRTLGEYLRNFISNNVDDWDNWISTALFTYNSTPHTSTGYMPFELVFGYKPIIPTSLTKNPEPLYNYDSYVAELKNKFQHCWKIARDKLIQAKFKSKSYYDKNANIPNFQVGDLVLLKNEVRNKGKLDNLWNGPYPIIDINSDENTTIRVNRQDKVVHNNRLKLFRE